MDLDVLNAVSPTDDAIIRRANLFLLISRNMHL